MRRLASLLAATSVLTVGFVLSAAPAATAAPVTVPVPFRCIVSAFGSSYDPATLQTIPVTVDAPASVVAGDDIDVTYTLAGSTPKNAPFPLEGVVTKARPSIDVRPAAIGTPVNVGEGTGPESTVADVGPYEEFAAPTPVTVSVPTTGLGPTDVTGVAELRVGVLRLDIVAGDDDVAGSTVTCTPEPVPATFAIVLITPAPDTEIPVGAVGGLGVAALFGLAGLGALLLQSRRRHA